MDKYDKLLEELWDWIWKDVDPVGDHGGCRDAVAKLAQAVRDLLRENERLRQSFLRAIEDYEKELRWLK
jgi:hypothetical protein